MITHPTLGRDGKVDIQVLEDRCNLILSYKFMRGAFEPPTKPPTITIDDRLVEIAAIPDEAIDTSDIPEATEEQFRKGRRR